MAIDETQLDRIESIAIDLLLSGDHPVLAVLRLQRKVAAVSARNYTGVGFFTKFAVPGDAPRLDGVHRLVLSDVHGEIDEVAHGVGFVLFIKNGVIDVLECFTYDGSYPQHPMLVRAYYVGPKSRAGSLIMLSEVPARDLEFAFTGNKSVPSIH